MTPLLPRHPRTARGKRALADGQLSVDDLRSGDRVLDRARALDAPKRGWLAYSIARAVFAAFAWVAGTTFGIVGLAEVGNQVTGGDGGAPEWDYVRPWLGLAVVFAVAVGFNSFLTRHIALKQQKWLRRIATKVTEYFDLPYALVAQATTHVPIRGLLFWGDFVLTDVLAIDDPQIVGRIRIQVPPKPGRQIAVTVARGTGSALKMREPNIRTAVETTPLSRFLHDDTTGGSATRLSY